MHVIRFEENPLIRPADLKPSREDFIVLGVFNAGCVRVGDEIFLLLRVAECPAHGPDEVVAPFLHPDDPSRGIQILRVKKNDPDLKQEDSRVFEYRGNTYLTSISHLRLARSTDGRRFVVDRAPSVWPIGREEEYGIEDPRITPIGDRYYINYTAVSRHGIATSLAVTCDFKKFDRRGLIFAPENRDVIIFPEQIQGRYVCYHRPVASLVGGADIWLARSCDLLHWGDHCVVCSRREGMWDAYKIGGGAVPIKTEHGWLTIYHGADHRQRYCLGAMLADLDYPQRVIARSREPILAPEASYECEGFFGNVVFSCGAVAEPDGRIIIYYGAADESIAAAETTIDDLLAVVGHK